MAENSKKEKRNTGVTAGAVGAGLAGAVVGATAGIAFADQKTRAKIMKLAQDANSALNRLMESLAAEVEKTDIPEKAEEAEKKVRKTVKNVKNEISSRTGR